MCVTNATTTIYAFSGSSQMPLIHVIYKLPYSYLYIAAAGNDFGPWTGLRTQMMLKAEEMQQGVEPTCTEDLKQRDGIIM